VTNVGHARVFAIAGPAMIANLTTPLLGLVSTTAIGRLGEAQLLGGVALAAVAFDCVFWLFGFLRMGTVAFTAQSLGAGDRMEIRAVLIRALLLATAIGLFLIALRGPLAVAIFSVMGGSAAVTEAATRYFHVRLWSAPFMLGNYVVLGWLVGQARTGIALAVQAGINVLNMALTIALVLHLRMGIEGAAIATVSAETGGFAAGLFIAARLLNAQFDVSRGLLFDRARWLRMLAVNRDIMIRTAALIGGFLFFTAQGAREGDLTLAANAVLYNFLMIGSFFLDGLANAAEQLCGQGFGARDRGQFTGAVKLVLMWSVIFGVAVSLVLTVNGPWLIDVMTSSDEVRRVAREFVLLAAIAPACGVLAYCFDGIYIGASWARDMRNLMLMAFATYLAVWYLLTPFGNRGLWTALLIFLLARGVLQALRYRALLEASFGARRFRPASLPQ
jgi:MATE family multidrug resistance protein